MQYLRLLLGRGCLVPLSAGAEQTDGAKILRMRRNRQSSFQLTTRSGSKQRPFSWRFSGAVQPRLNSLRRRPSSRRPPRQLPGKACRACRSSSNMPGRSRIRRSSVCAIRRKISCATCTCRSPRPIPRPPRPLTSSTGPIPSAPSAAWSRRSPSRQPRPRRQGPPAPPPSVVLRLHRVSPRGRSARCATGI